MRPHVTDTDRVSLLRRRVVRAGLVGLVLATAGAATACIFEESDYKGGGRLGRAATAEQAKEPIDESPDGASSSQLPRPDGG